MIIKVLESFIDKDFNERRVKGQYYLYIDENRAKEIVKNGLASPVSVTEVKTKEKKKKRQ